MYNVNNKKCIRNIANKNFKANKTKNIIAIVAILLTTLLFTALFTTGSVFLHSFEQQNFRQVGGYAHGSIKNVSYEEVEKFKEHKLLNEYGISKNLVILKDGDFAKNPIEIKYVDENYTKFSYVDLIEGKHPSENTNEMICDTGVLETLGIEPKLGEEITLTYNIDNETKITDTFILSGYWDKDDVLGVDFIYLPRSYVDKIVEENPMEIDSNYGSIEMSILLDNDKNIESKIITILEDNGFQNDDNNADNYRDIGVNWGYASAQANANMDFGTIIFSIILLLLFMLSGYLIIFNIFKISVVNDIRFYGLLKTIGTTGRQIRRMVYHSAYRLSFIGIPIGLVLGYLTGNIIAPFVMKGITNIEAELTVNPYIFIGGALFSLITVVISCKAPAKMASRVSPVEAVRYTENSNVKKKKRKIHKNNSFTMAMANMARSKGKTVVVVTSLSLAILIMQITVTFTNGFDINKYVERYSICDFLVGNVDFLNANALFNEDIALSDQEIDVISSLDGVEESTTIYGTTANNFSFYDREFFDKEIEKMRNDNVSEEGIKYQEKRMQKMGVNEDGDLLKSLNLYGMDDTALELIDIIEGDIKNIEEKNGIVAICGEDDYGNPYLDSNSKKIGDTLTIRYVDKWDYFDMHTDVQIEDIETYEDPYYWGPAEYRDKTYEVVAVATISRNMGYRVTHEGEKFILPESTIKKDAGLVAPMNLILDVDESKCDEISKFLTDYTTEVNSSLNFESRDKYVEDFKEFKNMFLMVGMLLSIIIGTIGILNFFNVILTSINVRKKEFAMLSSIGMTGKQLKSMLVLESLFYIAVTMIIAATLTVLTAPMLEKVLGGIFWFFSGGNFTITPLLVVLPIFLIVGICTPIVIYKMLNKQSIVERLRDIT